MFTISQAAQRTGIPAATLRAWERRYGIVTPRRTDSGYRLYDERALAALAAMRRLLDEGWSPAAAAEQVTAGRSPAGRTGAAGGNRADVVSSGPATGAAAPAGLPDERAALTEAFLEAASVVDPVAAESVLERAFGLGTFESVTDGWLMPALRALGEAWADGWVDVAGEHAVSHAVMRRLSQAFAAAASVTRGPRIVVALPRGSLHELGALAFATAARRRGLAVVYLGADLPVESWVRAVHAFPTRAAVVVTPTARDHEAAVRTTEALTSTRPDIVVAGGGRFWEHRDGVLSLPPSITEAVDVVDALAG